MKAHEPEDRGADVDNFGHVLVEFYNHYVGRGFHRLRWALNEPCPGHHSAHLDDKRKWSITKNSSVHYLGEWDKDYGRPLEFVRLLPRSL